jgi:hypothetical protein
MRAHLLRGLLAEAGVAVDVVTTSAAGQAFLAGLGTPADVLPGGFELLFDDRHRLRARDTEHGLAAYLASPRGLARDVARLRQLGAGARFVVNDSLHPAALWLAIRSHRPRAPRIVNLHGDNLWRATVRNFDGRVPGWASGAFQRLLETADARAFGRVVHSLAPPDRAGRLDGPARFRLPPLVAAPGRSRASVRAALGIQGHERLAAIYLNPHFRDPRLAQQLEDALADAGFRFYGVSEPWATRAGWRAFDGELGDVIAASDLFVSGAGMAALEQARRAAVPLLALIGEQPEQALNVGQASASGVDVRAVDVAAPAGLAPAIRALVRPGDLRALRPDGHAGARRLWKEAFLTLAAITKEEDDGTRRNGNHDGPGHRNQQPGGRWRRLRSGRAQPRPPAHPPARSDAAAGVAR